MHKRKKLLFLINLRGDTHVKSSMTGGEEVGNDGLGYGKNDILLGVGGWRVCECSGRSIFFFMLSQKLIYY